MIAYLSTLLLAIATIALAQNDCNPLTKVTCPLVKGLNATSHYVDFTQQTSLPAGWVLANYANVTFGPDGAKFWFNQRGNAPYIWTDFHLAYGRVDVELMIANGTGIITSSVLFSDDQDEIDWEFSGSNFASSSGKAYTNYFGKGVTGSYDRGNNLDVYQPQKQFHTYSFDWTPQTLKWLIDGVERRTLTNNYATSGAYQYPQTPSRLHIGMWDAGDPNTYPGTVGWAGGYTNYNNVPYFAILKTVKITTPYPCSSWQYPDNFSGKWADVKCTNQTVDTTTTSSAQPTTTSTINTKCTATAYTFVSGDTGYGIAQKFGIDFNALNASNPNTNWNVLEPNMVLKVPCSVTASTTSQVSSTSSVLSVVPVTGQVSAVSSTTTAATVATPGTTSSTVTNNSMNTITTTTSKSTSATSSAAASSTPSISSASSTTTTVVATSSSGSSSSTINTTKTTSSSSSATTMTTTESSASVASAISGWKYQHCVTDLVNPRSLNITASIPVSQLNNSACMSWCDIYGYNLAGTEYSGECYCGSQISNSYVASEGDCNMKCSGTTNEICGGPNRMNLYSKIATSSSTTMFASSSASSSTTSSSSSSTSTITITSSSTTVPTSSSTSLSMTPSTMMTVTTSGTTVSTSTSVSSSTSSSTQSTSTFIPSIPLHPSLVSKTSSSTSPTSSTSPGVSSAAGANPATSTTSITSTTPITITSISNTIPLPSPVCTTDKCMYGVSVQSVAGAKYCSNFLTSATVQQSTTVFKDKGFLTFFCSGEVSNVASACRCLLSTTTTMSTTSVATSSTNRPIIRGGPAARSKMWKRRTESIDYDEGEA